MKLTSPFTAIFALSICLTTSLIAQQKPKKKPLVHVYKHPAFITVSADDEELYQVKGKTQSHPLSNPVYDSIYNWQWNTAADNWEPSGKTIDMVYDAAFNNIRSRTLSYASGKWSNATRYSSSFDAHNHLLSECTEQWNGNWKNLSRKLNSYDTNDNLIAALCQTGNNFSWINSTNTTFAYDAANNRIQETHETWNGNTWDYINQSLFTFDSNSNLIEATSQKWNGSAWENVSRYQLMYDTNKNITEEIDQKWDGKNWININRFLLVLDSHNNLVDEIGEIWDTNNNEWANFHHYVVSYDVNDNRTNLLLQTWNETDWINSFNVSYAYDADNNCAYMLGQNWLNVSEWENATQTFYKFDNDHNLLHRTTHKWVDNTWLNSVQALNTYEKHAFLATNSNKYWNHQDDVIEKGDSTYYFFNEITNGLDKLLTTKAHLTIYPSPSNGMFTVSLGKNHPVLSIQIYNMIGEKIAEQFRSSAVVLRDVAKGVYVVKVFDGSVVYTKKIIVE